MITTTLTHLVHLFYLISLTLESPRDYRPTRYRLRPRCLWHGPFRTDFGTSQYTVRLEYCVPRRPVLAIYSHPSSISRCTCLTTESREYLPTWQSSHFMRTSTSGGSVQITAIGTLLPSQISTILLVIPASALVSVAGAATIPTRRNPQLLPQNVGVRQ